MALFRLNLLFIGCLLSEVIIAQTQCPLSEDPVIITNPASVIGNGSPASCTQMALQNAFNTGGAITCNCGSDPVTIQLTSPLIVSENTIFDGGHLVTLDGNNQTRIIDKGQNVDFTIQNTNLINGKAPATAGHFTNRCGGAILSRGGGSLKVIQCHFQANTVTNIDESDIAGGAVYVFGEHEGIFSSCTFVSNTACNGGAIGGLGSDIIIANCRFYKNAALGTSGGLRGHGGAINLDGVELAAANKIYSVCGSEFIGNHAETQGGASNTVFSDNVGARLEMDQCYFEGNYLRAPDAGNGGAIFHVVDDVSGGVTEMQFQVTRSTFNGNFCNRQGGGIWSLINGQGVIENCTFFRDSTIHIEHGLGGAASLLVQTANQGGWLVRNNTFAFNYAGLWAGGVFANVVAPTTWQNNILFENRTSNSNPWLGLNVNRQMNVQAGTNTQWPQFRPNATEDTRATAASIFTAANLTFPLVYQGGPTPTLALTSSGPAINSGSGCPGTDQRLAIRTGTCDLGAFEYGALAIPTNVHINGLQLGHKYFVASNIISADAMLLTDADFILDASVETNLEAGFEVALGASLEIR